MKIQAYRMYCSGCGGWVEINAGGVEITVDFEKDESLFVSHCPVCMSKIRAVRKASMRD